MDEWKPGENWYQQPRFSATLEFKPQEGKSLQLPLDSTVTWAPLLKSDCFSVGSTLASRLNGLVGSGRLNGFDNTSDLVYVLPDQPSGAILRTAGLLIANKYALVNPQNISLVQYKVQGTYRHNGCNIFCVDSNTGSKRHDLMCRKCSSIAEEDDFRLRIQQRASSFDRGDEYRIDKVPTIDGIISRYRHLAADKNALQLQHVQACRALGRSHARVLSMRKRLDNHMLTSDLKGLADDL